MPVTTLLRKWVSVYGILQCNYPMIDLSTVIDWGSIKSTGVSVVVCSITGGGFMIALGALAAVSTIVYNGIRIYKEIKNKKDN
jgi:hypothetical protein